MTRLTADQGSETQSSALQHCHEGSRRKATAASRRPREHCTSRSDVRRSLSRASGTITTGGHELDNLNAQEFWTATATAERGGEHLSGGG